MTTISPSLLACDFLNIESELGHFSNFKNIWFHLDIMDSHFVPNLTFGHPIVEKISKKTKIKLDAHFMVSNPEFFINTFKDFEIHNFTFHLEATTDPLSLIKKAKEYYPSVGISIKPNTECSLITDEILREIDLILIMSVEPGFGGQSFIEDTYSKIKYFKKLKDSSHPNLVIQVDGGVNKENSHKLIKAGANNLVAGSYIFKDGPSSYSAKIESLRS
ncbi:ribulose-phosphate 3-epimerase [Halobacteriovorax sp. HLS]|uniref:ribulose-phosphate 3-epimerase n=1 Tax=Halobacteriovorax sp. HLS TaxID=2234000 RepID=UPI000FDC4CD7|nr:ribulose-phosphate 3-epimerase [Halobacteriovorax sp. HLS]